MPTRERASSFRRARPEPNGPGQSAVAEPYCQRAGHSDTEPPPAGHPGRPAKLAHLLEVLGSGYALSTAASLVCLTPKAAARLLREERLAHLIPHAYQTEEERCQSLFDALVAPPPTPPAVRIPARRVSARTDSRSPNA